MTDDVRRSAIERAVRQCAARMLESGAAACEVDEALQAAAKHLEGHDHGRDQMLGELMRLEQAGRGREAAMLVARKFAHDPANEIQVESLARKLRRWRKTKRTVSVCSSEKSLDKAS